jgi:hypothetical protein
MVVRCTPVSRLVCTYICNSTHALIISYEFVLSLSSLSSLSRPSVHTVVLIISHSLPACHSFGVLRLLIVELPPSRVFLISNYPCRTGYLDLLRPNMRSTLILALAALPFINALTVSKSGQCGASNGLTCKGSTFGSCCSQHNYCGSTSAYCGTGCQSGYGTCISTTTPVTPAKVSTDGTCGGTKGYTCLKSVYGNCCSQYGFCGSTSAYCGTGCNSGFGSCAGTADSSSVHTSSSTRSSTKSTRSSSISTHTSSSAAPSSTLKVTINSRCGVGFTQFTCQGSKWGNCCSQYSYWYVNSAHHCES